MNLPNKLTMLRIILIPVFLVLVLVESIPLHYLWALIVFWQPALPIRWTGILPAAGAW